MKKSNDASRIGILTCTFISLIILVLGFCFYRNSSDVNIIYPSNLIPNDGFEKYLDTAHDSFEITGDKENGTGEDQIAITETSNFLEKGTYTFMLSYVTDAEGNGIDVYSGSEMTDNGEKGVLYSSAKLDPGKKGIKLTVPFSSDATNVEVRVHYAKGNLKIGQLEIGREKKYTDALWFTGVLIVVIWLVIWQWKQTSNDIEKRNIEIVLLMTVLLLCLPYLNDYMLNSGDFKTHAGRIEGIYIALRDGTIPIAINQSQNSDWGYIMPAMYPQLFLYIPAAFMMLGMSLMNACKLFYILICVFTVVLSYISFKNIMKNRYVGALGSVIYSLAVYRMTDQYTRGALGETLAMIFLPVLVWGAYEILVRDESKWYISSLGFAGILHSHIITSFLCGLFALVYILVLLPRLIRNKARKLIAVAKSMLVTILLSLGSILPFVYYYSKNYNTSTIASACKIDDHVLYLQQIFAVFGNANSNCSYHRGSIAGEMTLSFGAVILVGVVIYFAAAYKGWLKSGQFISKDETDLAKWTCVGGAISAFMSSWLFPWNLVQRFSFGRIMSDIQFPWRLLTIGTVLFSVTALMGYTVLLRKYENIKKYMYIILIGIFMLYGLYYIESTGELNTYKNRCASSGENSSDDLYLYKGDSSGITENANIVMSDDESAVIKNYIKRTGYVSFEVNSKSKDVVVDAPIYNYPGYKAYVNDKPVAIETGKYGAVRVNVTGGYGSVVIRYYVPWFLYADWIVSFLILCTVCMKTHIENKKSKNNYI